MDTSTLSTNTSLSSSSPIPHKTSTTMPICDSLQKSLCIMSEQQILLNLVQLNLVSMYNTNILQKLYSWSRQTKFYLQNRYLLQKVINQKSKINKKQKSVEEIVQRYDTMYVNGALQGNAKQRMIIKHGLNKQLRAQFISNMEEFSALLDDLSLLLKVKSKQMSQQNLQTFFKEELMKINKSEVHAIISPNKLELAQQALADSLQQQKEAELQQISSDQFESPKKLSKQIFTVLFKGKIQKVKQIIIENCKFMHTKNRCPMVLDFQFSRFIYKNDNQLSHEIISMHLIKYINHLITPINTPKTQHIIQYEIIPQSHGALYQFVQDSMTVNQIKQKYKGGIVQYLNFLEKQQNHDNPIELSSIRKRFAQTFAGFSICQYLLDLKDRNNSNIMIRKDGSIFHIDLAFIFNATPGGIGFENCPFKFTNQYLEVMGGFESDCFKYYETLMLSNMTKISLSREQFLAKISILSSRKDEIACFKKFKIESYKSKIPKKPHNIKQHIQGLIINSHNNWRTKKYDDYQFNTNKILP